jgi:hypothetical protein
MTPAPLLLSALACAPQDVGVDVLPPAPLIERHRSHLSLQCDFRISNFGSAPVALTEVVLLELDAGAQLIRRRFVDRNGTAPSIQTVVGGPVPVGGEVHVFNPFHHFELEGAPARLDFVFTLASGGRSWKETVSFDAAIYETRTPLRLPMDGRVLVKDGHDFLSHHRRVGMDHPVIKSLGLEANASRYGYDLVVLGPDGAESRGPLRTHEDSYSWGAPVVAPGAGRVVRTENDFPDTSIVNGRIVTNPRVTPQDMNSFAGNYVVIDHGKGEFSSLGHLRRGSVVVEVGQEVQAGDPLGEIGLSGSVTHVHLHYHLQTGPSFMTDEGLPSSFSRYRLHRGGTSTVVTGAPVDTGDIVEHVEERGG